jgi:hypothetical protein
MHVRTMIRCVRTRVVHARHSSTVKPPVRRWLAGANVPRTTGSVTRARTSPSE